jgi:hypothetical protein
LNPGPFVLLSFLYTAYIFLQEGLRVFCLK